MLLNKNQVKALFGLIGVTLISYVIYRNLDKELRNVINFLSLFGTGASLYGIWLAFLSIQSIKETTESTNIAIKTSLIRVNQLLSVSDISKAAKIVQEIQTSLLSEKLEVALIRMKDLKHILIQIKYNQNLEEFTSKALYQENIKTISIDINNLSDFLLRKKTGVNFSKINQNLEEFSTVLVDFENKLKFLDND